MILNLVSFLGVAGGGDAIINVAVEEGEGEVCVNGLVLNSVQVENGEDWC